MSSNDENNHSEDEYNVKAHKSLLQAVSRLGKTQHIKKPTRSEPALAQNEFHLVKTGKDSITKVSDTSVGVSDLVKVLNKTKKHLNIGKELRNTQNNKKILPKPLERPVAEKIQRTIGYEKIVKKLGRWDAVVANNRSSDNQIFPLDYEEIHVDLKPTKKPQTHSIKSDLMIEMEAIEQKLRSLKGNEVENLNLDEEEKKLQRKLTKDELIARRKELAFIRIRESQKSAKARLQNKIKSKKYHKFLKREKLKEQIKEFEIMQNVNPEAALEKLEKIEKNRILERANLRHKNTGTWAKNLQIRAKYDKDVRKDLSEQLALSRELTQKEKDDETDDNDEAAAVAENEAMETENNVVDPFNPWIKVSKKSNKNNEVEDFVSGYRKYWMERNKNENDLKNYKNELTEENGKNGEQITADERSESEEEASNLKNSLIRGPTSSQVEKNNVEEEYPVQKKRKQQLNKKDKMKNISKKENHIENGWLVEIYQPENTKRNIKSKNIDDIFDEAEDFIQDQVSKKLKIISDAVLASKNRKRNWDKKQNRNELQNLEDLTFKNPKNRPEFDEELLETTANNATENENSLKKPLDNITKAINENQSEKSSDIIDPNKFANIKPKRLTISDMVNSNEFFDDEENEDTEGNKQMTIAEAFEDDDIVADFEKDKNNEEKNIDNEIDLSLPGWGSWGGAGIDKSKHKKRLVLKFPKEEKRRDDNKANVYINEDVNKKLKSHLVSDLPFPFTSVKDYEASIRAPIGRSFVPETAFRMLTRPEVVTKMGQVIEPMDENILVKKPKPPKSVVDARIEKLIST